MFATTLSSALSLAKSNQYRVLGGQRERLSKELVWQRWVSPPTAQGLERSAHDVDERLLAVTRPRRLV